MNTGNLPRGLVKPLVLGLIVALGLVACNGGGGGGNTPPPSSAPEYVEAGLVVYDSLLLAGQLVPEVLAAELAAELAEAAELNGAAELRAQALPMGSQALLKVFWKSVTGAEGYRIFIREAGGTAEEIASLGAASTEFTMSDLMPAFTLEEGHSYEVGVAAVRNDQSGQITWSWRLKVLGPVTLTSPRPNSDQGRRPSFVWSNAAGNPSVAEISIVDANNFLVTGGTWVSAPLPSTATSNVELQAGKYRWVVVNAGTSQAIQDPRMQVYFPSGHAVLSLPSPVPFYVDGGGGNDGGGNDGGGNDGGGNDGGGGPSAGDFNIELIFGPNIEERHKQLFRNAAANWERLIVGDLPNASLEKPVDACRENDPSYFGEVDDVAIFAEVDDIDGEFNTLAYAGPCMVRINEDGSVGLTIYGIMRFDRADMAFMDKDGGLQATIMHEMGHVLGIGTLWDHFGLMEYQGDDCFADTVTQVSYTGPRALAEWRALGGSGRLPIENDYGPGTKCGHWDHETFYTELMTGFANAPGVPAPASRMTVASFADLGYEVDFTHADPYQLPACSPTCGMSLASGEEPPVHSTLIKPLYGVGPDGELTPLPKTP